MALNAPGTPLLGDEHPLIVVVGSGGVGKTTLAAALGLTAARDGRDTLVMTFDPSLRLKDALGVGEEARDRPVPVALGDAGEGRAGEGGAVGRLDASLLDARRTFDRLVERYAPDEAARRRILDNRFYAHLAGSLAGILEYMAVERLWEVASEGTYRQVVLDTPPTRQALDFLEAPSRIVGFLESGALKVALRPWFDDAGRLKGSSRLGFLGRRFESFLDEIVGLDLLRDMAEFFQAFEPLYGGFRERARQVEELLRSPRTLFVLVSGPGEERIADTLFFARRLGEAGYHLGPIVVNRVHPQVSGPLPGLPEDPCTPDGRALLAWLGERDHRGLAHLRGLVPQGRPLVALPLLRREPTDLASLEAVGRELLQRLDRAGGED
ncbi:MAG TPA: ArsA-related P-loop ATPase [Thermoanaerobaculia bacterium]|nr:ArsA-related P-loop ATPase [Thermoanaerobaculia bacterium]